MSENDGLEQFESPLYGLWIVTYDYRAGKGFFIVGANSVTKAKRIARKTFNTITGYDLKDCFGDATPAAEIHSMAHFKVWK